jgi:hypothetical protein
MNKDVQAYNNTQSTIDKKICNLLAKEISANSALAGVPKKNNTPLLCVERWLSSKARHQQHGL